MENVSHALQMAFAVFVLVFGLGVAMTSLNKAKTASDSIYRRQEDIKYYQRVGLEEDDDSASKNANRTVGIETVIPTLYSYYKENYTVLFYKETEPGKYQPLKLYQSEASTDELTKSNLIVSGTDNWIYGFDISDERARREPWADREQDAKAFVDSFIQGVPTPDYYSSRRLNNSTNNYHNNANHTYKIKFGNDSVSEIKGLYGKELTFIERFGEYAYGKTDDTYSATKPTIMLDNNELVEATANNTKRVIQYIIK